MSFLIIFTLGYIIGGVSALVLIGLTVAGRSDSYGHRTIELVSHDETYRL